MLKLSKEIVVKDIKALKTIQKVANKYGITRDALNKYLYQEFPLKQDKRTWLNYLYSLSDEKVCNICNKVLPLQSFRNNSSQGKQYACRPCELEYNKPHKAKYRESIKNQTSSDANMNIIKAIYQDCFDGYHVDHIIPLAKGGRHHEANLCWLPSEMNLSKGSKMPDEVQDIMRFAIFPNLDAY